MSILFEVLKDCLVSFASVLVNVLAPFFGWLTVATLHLTLELLYLIDSCRFEIIGNILLKFISYHTSKKVD